VSTLTGSLVLYNSSKVQFETAIEGFIAAAATGHLYVMDNSPSPLESEWFAHPQVTYVFNGANLGFGVAHNRAVQHCCNSSDVHLILNPDIRLNREALSYLLERFERDNQLAAAMPKILYPDGALQRLCKLLPTPYHLLVRRFLPASGLRNRLDLEYELHFLSQKSATEVPSLSGCFLMVRSRCLLKVGGFDERFFMYMEDVDLVRRLGMIGKTMYFPSVSVVHEYAKGSYKNPKLLRYHMRSAVQYFNKWGWFFDKRRSERNNEMLSRAQAVAQSDLVAADANTLS
jgi:GT2 family glycosyltransferase